jgi:hypothetical protein
MGRMKQPWFATFMFLDVSGTITSSQYERLSAAFARAWRRLLGR